MSNHPITLVEGVQSEVYPQCSLYEAEHNDASVMCTEATMSSRPARGGVTHLTTLTTYKGDYLS